VGSFTTMGVLQYLNLLIQRRVLHLYLKNKAIQLRFG
jgi:hypothetical protein